MLKWLVTRGPTTAQPPRKVVTDDPLATLRVKTKDNTHQIYAVSRVNPLYHDEEVEITAGLEEEEEKEDEEVGVVSEVGENKEINLPESPPTDRGSVRSSGYGSKETDSVSEGSDGHDEDDLLGAEVEAALKPPPAPAPFSDSHNQPDEPTKQLELQDTKSQNLTNGGKPAASQSVAQLCKSFEDLSKSENAKPTVITAGGKPVAAIIAQHPQFVKAIEVGMRRAKSLETIQQQRVVHNSGSSTVPRPIWPRASSLVESPQRRTKSRGDLSEQRASASLEDALHERIPSPVDILKQDLRYVTSIHVSPKRPLSRAKSYIPGQPKEDLRSANNFSESPHAFRFSKGTGLNHDNGEEPDFARYFGGEQKATGFPLISLQPDSLVTEDTLRMMRYGLQDDFMEEENEPPIQAVEKEISAPLPDFSQVMYTRGLYATLNRAASLSTKDIVKPPYKTRSKSIDISIPNRKSSAKKNGLSSMKHLWEKSGLKTNGRKLIVDVNDLLDSSIDDNDLDGSSVENLRSLQSAVMANALRSSHLENSLTSSFHQDIHTYEDPNNYGRRHTSHPESGTMESRFSDTYAEINDIAGDGIDNPAFLDDAGHHHRYFNSNIHAEFNKKPRFLDPDKLADFQKRISEKLQGAPHHRTQWLDLDEIVIEGVEDKHERRVKFTSDTINPESPDHRGTGGRRHTRSPAPPVPGGAVRTIQEADVQTLSGRQLPEITLKPSHLVDNKRGSRDLWTSSESYRDRFQEAPPGTVGRGKRQKLWESYYGTNGSMDRTFPRHLAPHPNSKAPICAKPSGCHDFTLDLRRSHKLNLRSEARRKRRRCYTIVLVFLAFVVFLGMVVVISWYCTGGEKFFGPI